MLEDSAPLLLGSRAIFTDNHSSRLTTLEVDESWQILNIAVSRGAFRWIQRVRLPFSVASSWSESAVHLTCTRTEAFSREIPPIATPSRPISTETPLAPAGSRLTGALVNRKSRKVTALIVRLGAKLLRVRTADVIFEGKTLRLTVQPNTLPEHRTDRDIVAEAWSLLHSDNVIMPDELKSLAIDVAGGIVTIKGSVRRKSTKERAELLVAEVTGITELRSQLKDDLQLEIDIAAQLDKTGVQRLADIYPRSSLGDITLLGRAPLVEVADDAVRITSSVAGVDTVTSRIEVEVDLSSAAKQPRDVAVS